MVRPLRIQYQNAWYHVMNRGAGRQQIFLNKSHRLMFLDLLQECHKMFNVKICAYCLMDIHYHLLLFTPEGNLSRVMRHLNGVYTQKYNKTQNTDGSLFRGRYKAQLIEDDCYQLIVSRYIHLNPVEAGLVENPADYEWSSYAAYVGLSHVPDWLSVNIILQNFTQTKLLSYIKNYKDYVEESSLEEINVYTSIKNVDPIVGSERFKKNILLNISESVSIVCSGDINRIKTVPDIATIIEHVSAFYNINQEKLVRSQRAKINIPRLICMYICRIRHGHTLKNIARHFGIIRQEAVSASIYKCKQKLLSEPGLLKEIDMICDRMANSIDEPGGYKRL